MNETRPVAPPPPPLRTRVLVVGGGLAGMTMAAALGRYGVDTIVVDRLGRPALTDPGYDGRTTAISLSSRRVLEGTGIWARVAGKGEPILDIRIADDATGDRPGLSRLHFDHTEIGREPFGHIVDNRDLRLAQFETVDALPSVRHLPEVVVVGLSADADGVDVALADGRVIRSELVIGADGRGSLVRDQVGIEVRRWGYDQTALVCVMGHSLPHHGVALEHFLPAGPFAVLPMTDAPDGGHRSSVVWTERPAAAQAYLDGPVTDFEAGLARRVNGYLGAVRLLGRRFAYPLGVLHAERYAADRVALLGEAAHAIHPIAGQGLNLSLRDVAALTELIVDRARLGLDVGDRALLTRYERWRRPDTVAMLVATDGLNCLFATDAAPIKLARNFGLGAVGRMQPVKAFFMKTAMGGSGRLPRMVRGEAV